MSLLSPRRWRRAAIALAAAAATQALSAQGTAPEPRVVPVPATVTWQHAETELILRPEIAGLRRSTIRDTTADELDVVADYADEAEGITATVYLFKTAVPDPALWFDRALTAMMLRPGWNLEGRSLPAVTPFARPGTATASALRASIEVGAPDVRSSAVAVAPLDTFLVKIRLSAARLDQAGLDALMDRFMAGIGWPTPSPGEQAAAPIQTCPEPLRLRRARIVQDDVAQVLGNLVAGAAAAGRDGPGPVYCREPSASLQHGVYRPNASRDAYLVALGDSGVVLSVGRALDMGALLGGGSGQRRYAVTLLDRETTSAYPSFNRLPPPDQALAAAFGHSGPVISATTRSRPER